MKHSVLGGLTVAVALSIFGAHSPSYAQAEGSDDRLVSQDAAIDSLHQISDFAEPDLLANSDASPLEQANSDSVSRAQPPSAAPGADPVEPDEADLNAPQEELATVFAHALDTRQAATIYIRSIPVMTLIGGELASLGGSKELAPNASAATAEADPTERANAIVARLTELAATEDAAEITARWQSDRQVYVIAWNDQELVTVNSRTILPDTTADPAQDTLQMANRLRRLLGNAPALSTIEGLPQPEAQVAVVRSTLTGMASWYGPGFHGRRSASGEPFNQNALTAAHRTLPFGTRVRVTNLRTGQQVIVRINDRGPFGHGRIIDLSAAAANSIGIRASGVGQVRLEVLGTP